MEIKKYDKYSLDKKRVFFLQIGFVVSLLLVIILFEVVTIKENKADATDIVELDLEYVPMEIIRIETKPNVEPKPVNSDFLKIVNDNTQTTDYEEVSFIKSKENTTLEVTEYEPEEIGQGEVFSYDRKPIYLPSKCKTVEQSEQEILRFIKKNMIYPEEARENEMQAKIYVKFMIDKNGILKNPMVLNKSDKLFEQEALRIIKKLNTWEAGYLNGQKVDMWYTIPIVFKLR